MNKALLVATDEWKKVLYFSDYLKTHPQAGWRIKRNWTELYIRDVLSPPLSILFFHQNYIRYRAHCMNILRGNPADWPMEWTPPEYRDDAKPYSICVLLDRVESVPATHISEFPMYRDESKHYPQGSQATMLVVDFLQG